MCFVDVIPLGLDVHTATGNLYFTRHKHLMRSANNGNSSRSIHYANAPIFGIAIDQLNR